MEPSSDVPQVRIRSEGIPEHDQQGEFVLYWMTSARRTEWNFGLQRAVDWSVELGKPLVVLEALRVDYRWACDRFHAFVIQGMHDNAAAFSTCPAVEYFPYIEPERGAASGLLEALARRAAVVVTDDFPSFFLPAQLRAARRVVPCRLEAVDSNGLYPMHATEKVFARAYDFRRHLQKELPQHLPDQPEAAPFRRLKTPAPDGLLKKERKRWPPSDATGERAADQLLPSLPINHQVRPIQERGGNLAAQERMRLFLDERLGLYAERRNQPEEDVPSGLSSWLHWGHLSAHQIFAELVEREGWSPDRLSEKTSGARAGWWGMSETAESFLDELVTWREVGYNFCAHRRDYDRYESLPEWARASLEEHARDERPEVYSLEQFDRSKTHDPLWNAAQRQLVREGRIHNYLRMLWGKKILHWSESPREALQIMIELNNKYAIDGRNPNSYSGIFWVLGRYDRAWGPEREIFGKIRYMSSENTARKVRVKDYIERYAATAEQRLF